MTSTQKAKPPELPLRGTSLCLLALAVTGKPLANVVGNYICTGKDWLIFDHWEKLEDGMVIMRDAPSPETPPTPGNPSPTPTPTPEQPVSTPTPTPKPVASLPQTGDNTPLGLLVALAGAAGIAFGILLYKRRHTEEPSPEDDPQYEDRT